MEELDELMRFRRTKLFIPIRRESCIERFSIWLAKNPIYWDSEVQFLHVMRPNWFDSIPYSASQAVRLMEEQESLTAAKRRELQAITKRIEERHPSLSITIQVQATRLDGELIARLAREWNATFILVFAKHKTAIERLFGNQIINDTVSSSNCAVQIIQPEELENNIESISISKHAAKRLSS